MSQGGNRSSRGKPSGIAHFLGRPESALPSRDHFEVDDDLGPAAYVVVQEFDEFPDFGLAAGLLENFALGRPLPVLSWFEFALGKAALVPGMPVTVDDGDFAPLPVPPDKPPSSPDEFSFHAG